MLETKENDFFDLEEESFATVIESDITFTGNIRFSKPFLVRGKIVGKIDATGDLVIDTDAQVDADIEAARVLVKGKVKGNVTAPGLIFVTQTGSLTGDIVTGQVVLEPGSSFTGRCTMVKENEKKQ